MNCGELIGFLERNCGYRYYKADPLTYEKTKDRIPEAKANSVRCRQYQSSCHPDDTLVCEMNPYKNIDELVTAIEEFSANE